MHFNKTMGVGKIVECWKEKSKPNGQYELSN